MTLLITAFAAIFSTVIWYGQKYNNFRIGMLCWMYWGAALMWLVDAAFEYVELGAEFFTPAPADMLNDAYLGLYVVALGLFTWIVTLLISDPLGTIKKALVQKN